MGRSGGGYYLETKGGLCKAFRAVGPGRRKPKIDRAGGCTEYKEKGSYIGNGSWGGYAGFESKKKIKGTGVIPDSARKIKR